MTQTLDQQNWGLTRSPFSGGLQQGLLFEGVSVREALARMRFLRSNARLGLLSGAAGTGKSHLLRVFADDCRKEGCAVANVGLQGLSPREFYWELGSQLGSSLALEAETLRLFRRVADSLTESSLQGVSSVLLLDDVDHAGPDLVSQLVRLIKLKDAQALPVSMVISCSQEALNRLPAALTGLIDLQIELEPWDELDTVGYLQLALVEAGCQQPLFDDASLAEIHRLAGGVPRTVKRLADAALLLGSSTAPEIIDTETVKAAHQRLSPQVQG